MYLKNTILGIQGDFAAGSQNNTTPQFRISRYIIGAGDHYSGSDTEPTKRKRRLYDVFHNVTIPMYVYIDMFTWF